MRRPLSLLLAALPLANAACESTMDGTAQDGRIRGELTAGWVSWLSIEADVDESEPGSSALRSTISRRDSGRGAAMGQHQRTSSRPDS